jgi:hypothetical protein
VLFHQLRQDLVFLLQLGFQKGDPLLARLDLLLGARRRSEGHRPVVKEDFQPAIEDRRTQMVFVAPIRHGLLLHQMALQDRHLLLGRVTLLFVVLHGVLHPLR